MWKSRSLQLNDDQLRFHGAVELYSEIQGLERPIQFFNSFLSNPLINNIVQETTLYFIQNMPEQPLSFQCTGIIIYT